MSLNDIQLILEQSPYSPLIIGVVVFLLLLTVIKVAKAFSQSQKNKQLDEKPLEVLRPQSEGKQASLESQIPKPTVEESQSQTLRSALKSTKESFWERIKSVFVGHEVLSQTELEQIEEVLYTSDLGPQTVETLMKEVNALALSQNQSGADSVRTLLKTKMLQIFSDVEKPMSNDEHLLNSLPLTKPISVWMLVGVNGAGKTTTIGKLASILAESGKRVLLAAGDTFRAAAGDQLRVWTERAQVEIFSPSEVKDPSAVAFDAVQKGLAQGYDVVIIDTAGRLHTQKNLMEELKKMKRVIQKVIPAAPHETLLVLDANQGQNALIQAKEYHAALDVTGVILTKLDGTAKGGVALGVAHELKLPIRLIGVGEKAKDLRPFESSEYVDSLLGIEG